ncbi:MAG TPA: shikimate kinase [Pedobacter sp.]|uniref:shikimate kinase n=1 Tax=Pedobacter sp. TaxID=1411316 RepID=UPI002BD6E82E|nr:shikimate kinase [Pedobacter sp.]HMI02128.1 shikimate kinase [Pedobacter sp.]
MKKIILLGYMGSGKSTVAKLLASNIGFPYADLDDVIENESHASISELFEKRGEIYFRKLEHQLLEQIMQKPGNLVLSLGGGTPCYANNCDFFKAGNVVSIYLKGSVDTLYERLLPEKEHRPLIAQLDLDKMKEFIAISLFERSYYYTQASHTISIDGKTPDEIVSGIESFLI